MSLSAAESDPFSSPVSTISSLPSVTPTETMVDRSKAFYVDCVIFQVENTLFKIPRFALPEGVPQIDALFAEVATGSGLTDENPIRLDPDVSAADFLSLLKAAVPSPGKAMAELALDEWRGVLILSNKWGLDAMKALAVAGADEEVKKLGPVAQIELAKRYGVPKWLREGYRVLVSRKEPITVKEREALGWEIYGRLMDVREKGRAAALQKPISIHELGFELLSQSVDCEAGCDGAYHKPYCTANALGDPSGERRYCNRCGGHYHPPGCSAGKPPPKTVQERVQDACDAVDWDLAIEQEFGACVTD